jgi:hypothetical protein
MKNELYNGGIYNVTEEWKASHCHVNEIENLSELDTSVGTVAICPLYGKHFCYPTCMYFTVTADDAEECFCRFAKKGDDCFKEN